MINKYFNSFTTVITKPISGNILFFLMMYVLGMFTTFLHVHTFNFKIPRINFLTWVFDLYLLCIILTLLPRKIRTYSHLLITLFLYFFAIIDAFCVEKFRARFGFEILNVILETNPRESSEFVNKYIGLDGLLSSVGIIFLLIIFHYLLLLRNRKLNNFFDQLFKSQAIRILVTVIIIASIILSSPCRKSFVDFLCSDDLESADEYINNKSFNTPVNNLFFGMKMRQLANKQIGKMAEYQRTVRVDSCSYTTPQIVLIIGESYIKRHSQLYGYKKETTPRQLLRTQEDSDGKLIAFTDVVSTANLTSIFFKNAFSFHSVDSTNDWSESALFPIVFRLSGYTVFFITNQFVKSITLDIFNASGGLFLNDNRIDTIQFDHRNTISHQYDAELLADYDSLKQFRGQYNLIIFHLAGQHIDFYERSPDNHKKFLANDYIYRTDLNDSERQTIADYDNATLYNDFVVNAIIEEFKEENAVVIYMSDHGEECYDNLHRMGRLPKGIYSPEMVKNEYEIPFWIWCSEQYLQQHPDIFQQIIQASNRPFMTDDLPHLLVYLAGISYHEYDESRNILSHNFNIHRKRLLNGEVNYDSIMIKQKPSNL